MVQCWRKLSLVPVNIQDLASPVVPTAGAHMIGAHQLSALSALHARGMPAVG